MGLTLRVRHDKGQSTLPGLDPATTVLELKSKLFELCGTPVERQQLLLGFPPKPLQLTDRLEEGAITDVGIQNGDTLVVRDAPEAAAGSQPASSSGATASNPVAVAAVAPSSAPPAPKAAQPAPAPAKPSVRPPAPAAPAAATPSHPPPTASASTTGGQQPAPTQIPLSDGSCVVRRLIDSDNSCLFNAVGYVMEHTRTKASELRSLIAAVVASDPETYNEAFLGKPNDEYCRWIQESNNWGGAIELALLSQHYSREIAAYDIQTKRCDLYGQDAGHSERAMLIYDGLHYDAMAVSAFEGAPEELDITMFPAASAEAKMYDEGAKKLVEAAHKARQFTNTATFALRCGTCQIGLKGEKEAVEHAKATGHSNFSEY